MCWILYQPMPGSSGSEVSAQRKLQVADIAGLAGDLAEARAGRVIVHAAPVGVVGGIEGFRAELHSGVAFPDREVLEQTQVDVVKARVVNVVTDAVLKI